MFPNCHHGSTRVLLISVHTANCTRSRSKGPALLLVSISHRETKRAVVLSGPYKLRALSVRGASRLPSAIFFRREGGGALVEKLVSRVQLIISILALIALSTVATYIRNPCPTLRTCQKPGTEGAFKRL